MTIETPPAEHGHEGSSEAEALFEEAKEIERRRRRRWLAATGGLAAVGIAAVIGLGGGGDHGGAGLAPNHPGRPTASQVQSQPAEFTGTVAASGSVCSLASSTATVGDPPPGHCVVELPSGVRYQCPIGLVNRLGANLDSITSNSGCHQVTPPAIPVNWRPTIRQMRSVEACLRQAGLTVAGSPNPYAAAYPDTPIAAVLIAGAERPSIVSFYLTTGQAKQAYSRVSATVARQGQREALRGHVFYDWNSNSATEQAAERRCVQTA